MILILLEELKGKYLIGAIPKVSANINFQIFLQTYKINP